MQWYYSKGGSQLGPVAEAELASKLASGEISPADLVWKEGMADWIPALQVPELKVPAQAVAASTAVPSAPASTPVSPYAAPVSPVTGTVGPNEIIPNYLWQSIVVTIFCCWPLGIPAIIFAAKVDGLRARGDIHGAVQASANAKKWSWIAFGVGLTVIVLYIVFMVVGAAGALNQ